MANRRSLVHYLFVMLFNFFKTDSVHKSREIEECDEIPHILYPVREIFRFPDHPVSIKIIKYRYTFRGDLAGEEEFYKLGLPFF